MKKVYRKMVVHETEINGEKRNCLYCIVHGLTEKELINNFEKIKKESGIPKMWLEDFEGF